MKRKNKLKWIISITLIIGILGLLIFLKNKEFEVKADCRLIDSNSINCKFYGDNLNALGIDPDHTCYYYQGDANYQDVPSCYLESNSLRKCDYLASSNPSQSNPAMVIFLKCKIL